VDESLKLLEDMTISKSQLPATYCKLTLDPPGVDGMINPIPSSVSSVDHVVNLVTSLVELVDKVVDLIPSSVNPTLPPESETQVVDPFLHVNPILPLENETQVVNLISSSVDPTFPHESKPNASHVFLVDIESTMPRSTPPSPVGPPPSNEAILFNWGLLNGPRLASHIPFKIIVQVCGRDVPQMLIDEGSSVSILSSIAWKALGYPHLVQVNQTLLTFNRRTSHPLGILPQFLVTLGRKTVFIDVMVVQDPLDFDLLLGRDYVYAMKAIVSTLFHVISFPHDGRIVTIDQIFFIGPDLNIISITSLNGSYMQTISPLPQVNYVALSPMPSVVDADEPLTVSSLLYDLDLVVDMVISLVGLLDPDLLTLIASINMCSFQSLFLSSSEDLLESMTEFCPLTWCPSRGLSYWKS
jgi:hypothetical protein